MNTKRIVKKREGSIVAGVLTLAVIFTFVGTMAYFTFFPNTKKPPFDSELDRIVQERGHSPGTYNYAYSQPVTTAYGTKAWLICVFFHPNNFESDCWVVVPEHTSSCDTSAMAEEGPYCPVLEAKDEDVTIASITL